MIRRKFLVGSGLVLGGGLVLGVVIAQQKLRSNAAYKLSPSAASTAFNAWLTIDTENIVHVAVPRQEMGQGINTMLAMFVAEELTVSLDNVRVFEAPIAPVYGNVTMLTDGYANQPAPVVWAVHKVFSLLGVQGTGGSTSTRDGFLPMRTAAASAREMLVAEAAARWNLPANTCGAKDGFVTHPSGKKMSFGALAAEAAKRAVPASVALKTPKQWTLLGTSPQRLDIPEKVNGSAQFGIDVTLPNMLHAAVKHIALVRGALQEVRWKNSAPPAGVVTTAQGEDWFAVLSTNTWRAQKALQDVELVGGGAQACVASSHALFKQYDALLDVGGGREYAKRGAPEKALKSAPQVVDVRYRVPFQAHAMMEPLNCTAHLRDGKLDLWIGNQSPTLVRMVAANASGLPESAISVHTPYLGGGFGRRSDVEVLRQAIACVKVANGKPVKLTWSREEDIRHDSYRPAVSCRMQAAFDERGDLVAWHHHLAGMSVMFDFTRRISEKMASDVMADFTNCEGAAHLPYALPNFRVAHSQIDARVPLGFWRSVGNSYNAFFVESFIDELAHARNDDPYLFRLKLLKDAPRFARVLETVVSASQWAAALRSTDSKAPSIPAAQNRKRGRGLAIAESFRSIVAMVVEVSVGAKNDIVVERVVAAVDCGKALHPDNATAQIEGAIGFALSAALKSEITLKEGVVEQRNFDSFEIAKLADMPRVEVHFVASDAPLGGIGEVGVPPFAPALGNAIFAASGQRLRSLPFKLI